MKLQQRWNQLRTTFHSSLLSRSNGETPTMKRKVDTVDRGITNYLQDVEGYISWCQDKLVNIYSITSTINFTKIIILPPRNDY
jgi:hypothetical protein